MKTFKLKKYLMNGNTSDVGVSMCARVYRNINYSKKSAPVEKKEDF